MLLSKVKCPAAIGFMTLASIAAVAQTPVPKGTKPNPQPVRAPQPKPGSLSGRVFAITEGGDIKPARLAKIYLLYSSIMPSAGLTAWPAQLHIASVEYVEAIKQHGKENAPADKNWDALVSSTIDAASAKEKERLIALAEADIDAEGAVNLALIGISRALVNNGDHWTDDIDCKRDLLHYDKALVGVRKWRWEQKKWDQFLSADADEEGQFRIAVPNPGKHLLIVRGRAGFNEAFWSAEVTVTAGTETVVKLAKPQKACEVTP